MPQQYGPPIGEITWTSDPYGDHKITDSKTGMEVAVVMKVWLDGLLASPASVRQEDLDSYSRVIEDLRQKLDREIAVSRELAIKLEASDALVGTLKAERTRRQEEANKMAHAFMELHNLAKAVVGPKDAIKDVPKEDDAVRNFVAELQATRIPLNPVIRPTFGEMMKAAEAGEL